LCFAGDRLTKNQGFRVGGDNEKSRFQRGLFDSVFSVEFKKKGLLKCNSTDSTEFKKTSRIIVVIEFQRFS
jgi:hypothetical protein